MVTHPHDETRDRIAAELSRRYEGQGYEVVTERTIDASRSSDHAGTSSTPRSSSSTSSQNHSQTVRRPDVAVFEPGQAPDRDNLSPQSKKCTFPGEYPPLLAIEITSPSTRSTDLNSKWVEYEQAAVLCYVIVDCANERDPSVVVGNLTDGKYSKNVYRGDEIVQGSLFDGLAFSAQCLLDPPRSITEIRNSPIRKMRKTIRDKDHTIRDKDRALSDKDRTIRDKDRTIRDKDRIIRDLEKQLASQAEQKGTSSKAHGSTTKQSASSSGPGSSASEGRSPPNASSPSKPKNERSKLKRQS